MSDAIYTAHAHSIGGRAGTSKGDSGFLDVNLALPKSLGGNDQGTNPEELFAAGYSACFLGALGLVARNAGVKALGVSWGYHSVADLEAAGAHLVIHRMDELVDAVDRLLEA